MVAAAAGQQAGAMDTTSPDAPADEGPRVTRDEIRDLGRLRRSTTDRKVAGVAGGLARHLDVDPLVLRVGFVVLAFFGGAGLILYAACWLLVPEDGAEHAPFHLDDRSRTVALVVVGVLAALALLGDSWGAYWFPWPLAVIGLIAFVWLSRGNRGTTPPAAGAHSGDPAGQTASVGTTYVPRPRDPRKRGPKLFWFTLLLVVFLEGVLGILDAAGVPVTDSAYAALAVGVIGAVLVVGSVIGRAGGLIALGLVASLALAASTAAERVEGEVVRVAPKSAAAVEGGYRLGTGELVVDLSRVEDLATLDGRTLHVSVDAGRIEVIVPDGVTPDVDATIDGPGGFDILGETGGGLGGVAFSGSPDGRAGWPVLTIDADLGLGEITITQE